MRLQILAGSAHPALAAALAGELDVEPAAVSLARFPDGELHVCLRDTVRAGDVYLVQPTSPPVETHLLELLLLADACRRAGAGRLTAVVPYFGYARQDRRGGGREPVAARLVADLLATGGIQRLVVVDVHTPAIEGYASMPVEHLSAVSLLAEAARPSLPDQAVVVAPDLGAVHLAERYATGLGLPMALVHKLRVSGTEVRVRGITGDVRDRAPVLVDDMISTGGTMAAAIDALLAAGCRPEVTVLASHGLLVSVAAEQLSTRPVRRVIVTDSVPAPADFPLPLQVVSIAGLLGDAVRRLHAGHSLHDLLAAA